MCVSNAYITHPVCIFHFTPSSFNTLHRSSSSSAFAMLLENSDFLIDTLHWVQETRAYIVLLTQFSVHLMFEFGMHGVVDGNEYFGLLEISFIKYLMRSQKTAPSGGYAYFHIYSPSSVKPLEWVNAFYDAKVNKKESREMNIWRWWEDDWKICSFLIIFNWFGLTNV